MAARTKRQWQFYVYVIGEIDSPEYIGKGSGKRLAVQIRKLGITGSEVARFEKEQDAYDFERELIAELSPTMNKCAGGNGNRVAKKKARRRYSWEVEMDRIGTRVYAARMLLKFGDKFLISNGVSESKVENIRQVAYG